VPVSYIKSEFPCGPICTKVYRFKTEEKRDRAIVLFYSFFKGSTTDFIGIRTEFPGEPLTFGWDRTITTPYYLTFYIKLPEEIDAAIQRLMGLEPVLTNMYYREDQGKIPPMPQDRPLSERPELGGTEKRFKFEAIPTVDDGRWRNASLVAKVVGPGYPDHNPLCVCDSFDKAETIVQVMNLKEMVVGG
jgi:hypothetical protein